MKRVLQEVSPDNLPSIQINLLQAHQEAIIEHINTRVDYVFEKHDCTASFWFKTGNPSWKELKDVLNRCHENVLADKIDSGEILECINSPEMEGIHFYESKLKSPTDSRGKGKHFIVVFQNISDVRNYSQCILVQGIT